MSMHLKAAGFKWEGAMMHVCLGVPTSLLVPSSAPRGVAFFPNR